MSDESGHSEQQSKTMIATETSDKWGDPISPERQAELQGYLDRWQAENDHGDRTGAFSNVKLSGADVYWLAEQSGLNEDDGAPNLHLEGADLSNIHLENADLREAHLEDANLNAACLEDADLSGAQLEGATIGKASLERADLSEANLKGTLLISSHLQATVLHRADLEGAYLIDAHLEGADLRDAHLEGAHLFAAHLENAVLSWANLENAELQGAHMDRANLTATWFNKASRLNDAVLTGVTLDQVTFDQTNLTGVDWGRVAILGDEQTARTPQYTGMFLEGQRKPPFVRVNEFRAAVRANRLLAVALRNQGMNEDADRFAERAQICKRKQTFQQIPVDWRRPWKLPLDLGRWLFSWFLALLAGYGYHPGRSVCWYLAVIFGFAFAYYQLGPAESVPFTHLGSVVFSLTSFHGRGFFPGGSPGHSLTLDDPVTVLAALEAVVGLLIEISFIATFTQRFFGR